MSLVRWALVFSGIILLASSIEGGASAVWSCGSALDSRHQVATEMVRANNFYGAEYYVALTDTLTPVEAVTRLANSSDNRILDVAQAMYFKLLQDPNAEEGSVYSIEEPDLAISLLASSLMAIRQVHRFPKLFHFKMASDSAILNRSKIYGASALLGAVGTVSYMFLAHQLGLPSINDLGAGALMIASSGLGAKALFSLNRGASVQRFSESPETLVEFILSEGSIDQLYPEDNFEWIERLQK